MRVAINALLLSGRFSGVEKAILGLLRHIGQGSDDEKIARELAVGVGIEGLSTVVEVGVGNGKRPEGLDESLMVQRVSG